MRSLWLASAAIIISTGVALAQTSGPATPDGSTTATPLTDSGSSGTTATPPPGSNSTTSAPMGTDTGATTAKPLTDSGSSGSASTPPTTGAATAPSMAPATTPPPATTAMAPAPAKPRHHHNMMMTTMSMPTNGSAMDYLHYAKGAVKHGNKMGADNALAMAETRMLNGVVPQGQIAPDTSPAISSIENARSAVAAGKMGAAVTAIDMAMSQAGGMSTGAMAPAPASSMAPPPHPMMPMATKSQGEMGGAPAVGETSDSGAAGGPTHMGSTPASSPPAP